LSKKRAVSLFTPRAVMAAPYLAFTVSGTVTSPSGPYCASSMASLQRFQEICELSIRKRAVDVGVIRANKIPAFRGKAVHRLTGILKRDLHSSVVLRFSRYSGLFLV